MNKKAAIEMSLKTVIGLVIGVIVLFFVLNVGGSIYKTLFPDVSELTEKSLNGFDGVIQTMISGQKEDYLFFMSNGFQLVGFNKGENEKSGNYERPAGCFQKSCLVICKDNNGANACKDSELVKAYDFDKIEGLNGGVITKVQGKYVNLEVDMNNNSIKILEKDK
nr:hypothetical protein [Nanoarchaeum sp.]